MGARGKAPAPTALKLVRGDRSSRVNRSEPKPPEREVICPTWLTPDAKRIWRENADELVKAGVLTVWDAELFGQWCEAVVQVRRARRELGQRKSLLVKGSKGQPMKHPALQIVRDSIDMMLRISARFGFDPASRGQLRIGGGPGGNKDRLLTQ